MNWTQDLVEFASSQLSEREQEALLSRGVSYEQMELYQIGYLNQSLPVGLPNDFLVWADGGKKLDDMLVFPLTTVLGEIRGLQFRHVDKDRTGYIDFLDRQEPCLFGLGQAAKSMWESRSVYLVEGAFDLLPIQRAVPFVVATMTASANVPTVRLLKRFVRKVWLGFDMDEPGRKGCKFFQSRHGREFEVYVVEYPYVNGEWVKDPGKLWEEWGDAQIIPFIRSTIERENLF